MVESSQVKGEGSREVQNFGGKIQDISNKMFSTFGVAGQASSSSGLIVPEKFLKTEKDYKEAIEAGKKDVSLLKSQLSDTRCLLTDAKQDIVRLTAELEKAKSNFNEAKFKVEFFGQSSKVVDILEDQIHKPGNGSKGLGYNNVL
ncbi:hypothetical protein L1987_62890 [Smallanthus sonchifolius]|uniref:Uncharacterized protein n=1 Tax=Smallanthus sonchifolius TaxID=185202 RepID=A0ACB9CBM5_9ASTR|nr:hypothetical protein L1987_62890 [Smallanthus sonchifolius]